LSAMTWETLRRPFVEEGSMVMRNNGALTIVLVIGRIETVACEALKESDCTMTAGRGFPNSPWGATVTMSPRFKRSSHRCRRGSHRAIDRCPLRPLFATQAETVDGTRVQRQASCGHRAIGSPA
jgi:hypothetical protein